MDGVLAGSERLLLVRRVGVRRGIVDVIVHHEWSRDLVHDQVRLVVVAGLKVASIIGFSSLPRSCKRSRRLG